MNQIIFAVFVFVATISGSNYAFARIQDRPPDSIKPQFYEPQEVVKMFLKAVSRGELTVFDLKIDQSMLKPLRVEYVYELDSAIPRVKVYSELKQPIPVPPKKDCSVHGIGATLDTNGHILEIEAYIRPE